MLTGMDLGSPLRRRTLLGTSLAGLAAGSIGEGAAARGAPAFVTRRIGLVGGVQSGDVSSTSAVLWAHADRPGRLVVGLRSGRLWASRRGPWATPDTDLTAKLPWRRLAPGREYEAFLAFQDGRGRTGEWQRLRFRTADTARRATSFVWTADTCGQGWGINPDLGGLVGYRTMLETAPDFFIHAGDTVYSDGPIEETVTEPDGQVWRNLVTPEVSKVAESLTEFRGRHRYTMLDAHVRAMSAEVPIVAQWDDHETRNNWYPGEILNDSRYTERRVDVLAARARRAWREHLPIADPRAHHLDRRGGRWDGFAAQRIYRKVERGAHLDVFCLDMRTFKGDNTPGLEPEGTSILGAEQRDWLIREVTRSTATWKVISADLPLGMIVRDGAGQEAVANGDPGAPLGRELEIAGVLSAFKKAGVRNVVWLTADVHYCAAHHYSPERAAFTDFDPFWEFVAGPIAAGTFGPNALDATFGPEVVFSKSAGRANESPRAGNQFFGHVAIDDDGALTVSLRDLAGTVLWSKDLDPEE